MRNSSKQHKANQEQTIHCILSLEQNSTDKSATVRTISDSNQAQATNQSTSNKQKTETNGSQKEYGVFSKHCKFYNIHRTPTKYRWYRSYQSVLQFSMLLSTNEFTYSLQARSLRSRRNRSRSSAIATSG